MPIYTAHDTIQALGNSTAGISNRSLYFDRFSQPSLEKDDRKNWFVRGINISVPREAQRDRTTHFPGATLLHARLMSRLMVNMAGGVMENAGLCFDRYGLPIIPGSAIKGCARRMAIQALHDWVDSGTDRPATDDACAPCCEDFQHPAAMLAAIARIFGWTPEDWKTDKKDHLWKSDFAWSVQGNETILKSAKASLPEFDTFGGTIAFLAASPNLDPGLELDVLTPHHSKYYESSDPNAVATDTEDPVPVFFPSVKPQKESDFFTFPLIGLHRSRPGDTDYAKRWLSFGLELLGIGAKTNAGYGWFEVVSAEKMEATHAAKAASMSAYSNDLTFQNAVISLLTNPGQYQKLQQEIKKLEMPENSQWLTKLKTHLSSPAGKDARKKLKGKEWFPSAWLPTS